MISRTTKNTFQLYFVCVCVCSLFSASILAETIDITEQQINKKMGETFPFSKKYQDVDATFDQPAILIDSLSVDDDITITTHITAKQNQLVVTAIGEISGNLEFDETFNVVLFRKPKLDNFEVINSNDASEQEQKHISRIVRQSMGNNLPKIILADLNKRPIEFGSQRVASIVVKMGKLEVLLEKR